jgi:integrase
MAIPMNLRKLGKYYYLWFSRSERPPNGQLISLKKVVGYSVTEEKEAKEIFKVVRREWHKGKIIELDKGNRITIMELAEAFVLDSDRSELSSDTHRMDKLSLKTLADIVGDKSVRTLTEKDFKKFKKILMARGLSHHSINSYRRHIRAALNYAIEGRYLKKIPNFKRVKTGEHLPRILTKNEIDRILGYAKKHYFEMWRMIKFSLWTGTRREEILNANWQNVTSKTIRIVGKGDKERTVFILPEAHDAMGNQKDFGPIFKQWHKDTISHQFKKIVRAIGIEDVHFHNLRHSAATYMIESGMHLKAVQKTLGHVDFRTTEKYIKIHDEFMFKEMEKLRY